MASASSASLMASGGFHPPPDILETTKGINMKFLTDVGKRILHVCKLQTKIPKIQIFKMQFLKMQTENFKLISQKQAILQNNMYTGIVLKKAGL